MGHAGIVWLVNAELDLILPSDLVGADRKIIVETNHETHMFHARITLMALRFDPSSNQSYTHKTSLVLIVDAMHGVVDII